MYLELSTLHEMLRNSKKFYKYLIVHLGLAMPRAKFECLLKQKLHLELSTLYEVYIEEQQKVL